MKQYNIKLTFGETTRKVAFASQPTWRQLVDRVEALFHVPAKAAAVKYTDEDEDEVTVSTDEELEQYYDSLQTDPKNIKLVVCKLQDAAADVEGRQKVHRKDLKPEIESSDLDDSNDQDSQRGPGPTRKSHAHSASHSASRTAETLTAHGTGRRSPPSTTGSPPPQGAAKRGDKRRKGRKGGQQVSAASAAPANRSGGGRHQAAPSPRIRDMDQPAHSAHGHRRNDEDEDDADEADDDDDDDDDDGEDADGNDGGKSFAVSVNIDDNNDDGSSSDDDDNDDDDATNPGFENDGRSRRREANRGRHHNHNSQQDAFGGQGGWANSLAPPMPDWNPFGGQFGGSAQFSWPGQGQGHGHGHGHHGRGSSRGGGDANSPFGGFDFNTWQPQPTPIQEMFSNLNMRRW